MHYFTWLFYSDNSCSQCPNETNSLSVYSICVYKEVKIEVTSFTLFRHPLQGLKRLEHISDLTFHTAVLQHSTSRYSLRLPDKKIRDPSSLACSQDPWLTVHSRALSGTSIATASNASLTSHHGLFLLVSQKHQLSSYKAV